MRLVYDMVLVLIVIITKTIQGARYYLSRISVFNSRLFLSVEAAGDFNTYLQFAILILEQD